VVTSIYKLVVVVVHFGGPMGCCWSGTEQDEEVLVIIEGSRMLNSE
jgi:hypothetical protein